MVEHCTGIPEVMGHLGRQHGPVARGLGLHGVAPGSNPILTSGLDLFPVVLDSTLPCFVNSHLVASCLSVGGFNHVSVNPLTARGSPLTSKIVWR